MVTQGLISAWKTRWCRLSETSINTCPDHGRHWNVVYGTMWILRHFQILISKPGCYGAMTFCSAEQQRAHPSTVSCWSGLPLVDLSGPFCPCPLSSFSGESTLLQEQGGKMEGAARQVLIGPRKAKLGVALSRNTFVLEPSGGSVLLWRPSQWVSMRESFRAVHTRRWTKSERESWCLYPSRGFTSSRLLAPSSSLQTLSAPPGQTPSMIYKQKDPYE